MNQACLDLADAPTTPPAHPAAIPGVAAHAFDAGGPLQPLLSRPAPAALMIEGHRLARAGAPGGGADKAGPVRALRRWFERRGDTATPVPASPRPETSHHCPITRRPFAGAGDQAPALVEPQPGLRLPVSRIAARAAEGFDAAGLMRHAREAAAGRSDAMLGLSADAWMRLATLWALATPLPAAEAARWPLRLLPPTGLRVAGSIPALQVALTTAFAQPGWSGAMRAAARALSDASLRADFHLFVGAYAPRVLEGAADGTRPMSQVLEDAWADARVQRRWQHLATQLGHEGAATWLARVRPLLAPARVAAFGGSGRPRMGVDRGAPSSGGLLAAAA